MAENLTLARPYAKAAFELAKAKGALQGWSKALAALASLSTDADVQEMFGSPQATPALRAASATP